jgi:hypothetical protein
MVEERDEGRKRRDNIYQERMRERKRKAQRQG